MKLGKAGWLSTLLEDIERGRPTRPRAARVPAARSVARAWLREAVRRNGLYFGTPRELGEVWPGAAPEEVLYLAVVRTFAQLAFDVAEVVGAPAPGPRELCVLFAVQGQAFAEAAEAAALGGARPAVPRRLWSRVEAALEERALSLSGDPAFGLVLHNGAVYVDALVFGRQAVEYLSRGELRPKDARRRAEAAAAQKALLVEVLTALVCAERQPSYAARRAILRQMEDLRLPAEVEERLRGRMKRCFERPPRPAEMVWKVRGVATRRFLLAQALLAARVDGRVSRGERAFVEGLAAELGFGPDEVSRLEVEVAEFYAQNRHVVDVFTVSTAAGVLGEELVGAMQSTLEKNFARLMTEIRETGELSVLLGRAARGQSLTRDERRRMRAQLIDIAKAIPALAIFAAPGGVLLLIALARVLPFSLLPSAFQDEPEPAPREPEPEDEP
jgi:hypothetical protein